MKYLKILLIYLLVSSLNAFADNSDKFSGLNIGLGIGATKYSQNYQDSNPTLVSYNATDFVSRLDASYAFKLDQNWLLGIGATYDLTKSKSKNIVFLNYGQYTTTHFETKNHYSIYLQPTYAVNDSLAIFGKLSFNSVQIDSPWSCASGCFNDYFRTSGVGYGIGAKKNLGEKFYLQVETEYVGYRDNHFPPYSNGYNWNYNSIKSYSGTLTFGYHF